jgi:hypothetical protein
MSLKHLIRDILRSTLALAVAIGLPVSLLAAAGPKDLTVDHPKVREVIAVQEQFTTDLMAQPEILGTAVGQDSDGEMVLVIYVNTEFKNHGEVMRALPPTLKGKRVRPELTEPFRAFDKPSGVGKPGGGGGGVSHTAKQTPPIQLGTSGGWGYDLANGYCCGGTLGSLVKIGSTQYILSNYHVFESDIVSGGNQKIVGSTLQPDPRQATTGDLIIQPGLIDVGCNRATAQTVATLAVKKSLPNSNVDCSVAQVASGMVRTDGAILEIGTISATTVAASINQAVKKSGRTTGLTRSTISGLNATVSVQYDNECAGGAAFTKTFTGQIVIANRRSQFLDSGDSGSLMVEDVTTNPKAVGLLFAGSNMSAIANPIGQVLSFLGASMVGN